MVRDSNSARSRWPSNIVAISLAMSLFFIAQILIILQPRYNVDLGDFALTLDEKANNSADASQSQSQGQALKDTPTTDENGKEDGFFNRLPIYHKEYKEGFHSNAHCVGENFQRDAWKFRSCQFQNLCFDVEDREFVLFQSEEQIMLEKALSHEKLDLFWAASNMNTTVSVGGLNPKWGKEHKDLEWYPKLRPIEDLERQGGYYMLSDDKILIPWHSMAGFNPGHLVWDDFLPLYTLLSIFDLTEKDMVLIRYDLKKLAMWASCQRQWIKCRPILKKFLPLIGVELEQTSTQNDTTLEIASDKKKSKYVCASNGAAGLGMLTDHGTKLHGWVKKDYEYAYNIGRGGTMFQFRNWMVDKLLGSTNKKRNINEPPYRIVISNGSSDKPSRKVYFHDHAKFLKKKLGSKYNLDVREVELAKLSMKEQVELASEASIFISMCGGGAVTSM